MIAMTIIRKRTFLTAFIIAALAPVTLSACFIDFLDYPQLNRAKSNVYLELDGGLSMRVGYWASSKRKRLTLNGPGYREPNGGADGIGIGDDEIGNIHGKSERLFIQFGTGLDDAHFTPVDAFVENVAITDLYFNDHASGYNEIGFYGFTTHQGSNALDEEVAYFQQRNLKKRNTAISGTQGEYTLTIDRVGSMLSFWTEEPASMWSHIFPELSSEKYRNNDFSVRGITFRTTAIPLPEPPTALSLLMALLTLCMATYSIRRLLLQRS